ncbi:MAG: ATP-binding cassette domain-containing protein [Deltaproteobacteria bacterium]|nr:ATP-binding cassette domain-containing protein [Deltaproteobacteria bacterium]
MSIVVEQITKRQGALLVLDHVSVEIPDGQLFVLLGASGSGKSTLLRIIAGLTAADSGRIVLHGRDVTALPPQERGVGFVFQNYSIFRHMSVAENIEFGMRIHKTPAAARARRSEELLDLVDLSGLGGRFAHQLSGGQQQRVALARALAYEPSVLLLDEPFGALDVKIRRQLRQSLREVQNRLGVTTVLVTHDQEEAFELADQIGIVERGRLLEVGPCEKLYSRPRTHAVATFLGEGTVLVGAIRDGEAHFGSVRIPFPAEVPRDKGTTVQLLFRPEQVGLAMESPPDDRPVLGKGVVVERTFVGAHQRVRLRLPHLAETRQIAPALPFGEEGLLVDALVRGDDPLAAEDWWVYLRGWHVMLRRPQPRVLICDPGEGPVAHLSLGARLVAALDAEGVLLAVGSGSRQDALRTRLQERQRASGLLKVALELAEGDVPERILDLQARGQFDLLIFGEPGRRVRRPARWGATVTAVAERAGVPLLVAKGERTSVERLLICTAAGEPGKLDVQFGGWLARRLRAHATLFYVARAPDEPGPIVQSHLERAAATLRALDVSCDVLVGRAATPTEGILTEARQGQHDLIILGLAGPERRSLFGLTDLPRQVLQGATQGVLLVPPRAE